MFLNTIQVIFYDTHGITEELFFSTKSSQVDNNICSMCYLFPVQSVQLPDKCLRQIVVTEVREVKPDTSQVS